MDAKDVFGIIGDFVVPLIAVLLAQQVISKREKGDRTMKLFYGLVSHVHEFAWAFYRASSHASQFEAWGNNYSAWESRRKTEGDSLPYKEQGEALGEWHKKLSAESVASALVMRKAAAALEADCFLLTMIFGNDAKELRQHLLELWETSKIFEHNKNPDFYKECFPVERRLREWTQQLLSEVSEFWKERVGSYEGL